MVNRLKPFTHASPRTGEPLRGSSKWLFLLPYVSRLTHDTLPSLHGLTSQETPHTSTPLVKNATSVGLATGKAIGTSVVNKANRISEQTRQAHLGLFVISMSIGVNMNTMKSGAGRIEIGSIHPWRNYARKDNNV